MINYFVPKCLQILLDSLRHAMNVRISDESFQFAHSNGEFQASQNWFPFRVNWSHCVIVFAEINPIGAHPVRMLVNWFGTHSEIRSLKQVRWISSAFSSGTFRMSHQKPFSELADSARDHSHILIFLHSKIEFRIENLSLGIIVCLIEVVLRHESLVIGSLALQSFSDWKFRAN